MTEAEWLASQDHSQKLANLLWESENQGVKRPETPARRPCRSAARCVLKILPVETTRCRTLNRAAKVFHEGVKNTVWDCLETRQTALLGTWRRSACRKKRLRKDLHTAPQSNLRAEGRKILSQKNELREWGDTDTIQISTKNQETSCMKPWLAVASIGCLCLVAANIPEGGNSINFELFWNYFLVGAMGAASLEVLKLYEYRLELTKPKYRRLLRSPLFWVVVGGMIVASGFFAWAINSQAASASVLQIATSGAAIRSLIRQTVPLGDKGTTLGQDDNITLRDIF